MIRSMTGYGRSEAEIGGMDIAVEIRSVNHRYFEFGARVPRAYGFLEEKLKSYIGGQIARGKVDVGVYIVMTDAGACDVRINHSLAEGYIRALKDMAGEYDLREDLSVMNIARFPDVLSVHMPPVDEQTVWDAVRAVTDQALAGFVAMREREGENMRADVLARRDLILDAVARVEERSPKTVKEHMDKVQARMKELLGSAQVDEQRLLTEAALFADKIAVAEETVRLRSHMDELLKLMNASEPVGRKLDFLVQEINREANTVGSKAQDVELARIVVNIKAEIEKIREQIQNIE